MNLDEFRASLSHTEPLPSLDLALQTLWWEAKGDWKKAHACAQEEATPTGARVHAYLHRVEGDLSNAGHWYKRADRSPATGTLAEEWHSLASELLARGEFNCRKQGG